MTLELALYYGGSLLGGIKRHPQLKKWIACQYPISINTDDSGIFCTNLTTEFLLVANAFGLGKDDLANIVMKNVDHIFDRAKRVDLKQVISARVDALKMRSSSQ
jgi:adenosine deaminase